MRYLFSSGSVVDSLQLCVIVCLSSLYFPVKGNCIDLTLDEPGEKGQAIFAQDARESDGLKDEFRYLPPDLYLAEKEQTELLPQAISQMSLMTELEKGRTLAQQGETSADHTLLSQAVSILRHVAERAGKAGQDEIRFKSLYLLGKTLGIAGIRQKESAFLKESSIIFNEVQAATPPDTASFDWIAMQYEHAEVLSALWSVEHKAAYLQDAIRVLENFAEHMTREHNPRQWADIQNTLGVALLNLGSEKLEETHWREKAVSAHQLALEIYTPETDPEMWAYTQMNLCQSMEMLHQVKPGTYLLDQALTACKAALSVYTLENTPYYWANSQVSLASVYDARGMERKDVRDFSRAISAYKEALKIYTPTEEGELAEPSLEWMDTMYELGKIHCKLGFLQEGEHAVAQLEECRKIMRTLSDATVNEPLWQNRTARILGEAEFTIRYKNALAAEPTTVKDKNTQ